MGDPIFPATTSGIVSLQDDQSTWLIGSDQGKLVVSHSDDETTWKQYTIDERGLAFTAVRDITLLKTFGSEQVVVFAAHAANHDGIYALVVRNGRLELLTRTVLHSALSQSNTISSSRHLAIGPGMARSFITYGNNLLISDWSTRNGQFSSRIIDLPFTPEGIATHPGWADGLPRVVLWHHSGSGNLAYLVLSLSGNTQDQFTGAIGGLAADTPVIGQIAGGMDGRTYLALGSAKNLHVIVVRNGSVESDRGLTLDGNVQTALVSARDGSALVLCQSDQGPTILRANGSTLIPSVDWAHGDRLIGFDSVGSDWQVTWLQAKTGSVQTIDLSGANAGTATTIDPATLVFLYVTADGWYSAKGAPPLTVPQLILLSDPAGAAQ